MKIRDKQTQMINRRRFLQTLAVAAATPVSGIRQSGAENIGGFGELVADPAGVIDLPKGFNYTVIAQQGQQMDDGLLVPGLADGMAAFAGDGETVVLVCNHELHPYELKASPFGRHPKRYKGADHSKIYDNGAGRSPGLGGTTTIHYDPVSRSRTHMHMSLMGTENNCAGGPTPWGSWLSCEECFYGPGTSFESSRVIEREKKHGYVFEVPASSMQAVEPVPLKAMGRFEHEAAAVDPATGVVYLTEDRHQSLLYRFIPTKAGELARGGRLQALAIKDQPEFDTRNWVQADGMIPGTWLETTWVDLEEPDVSENDLRFRGRAKGATIFARGEGLCVADGDIVMAATIGGRQRLGQIFRYRPSPAEGTPAEASSPGKLSLFAESTRDSILRHADNLTLSPWGDLIICEDTATHCGLVGIRPDGQQYALADNAHTRSELAGICFSPDGKTMFVNIQVNGTTLAITGPWSTKA